MRGRRPPTPIGSPTGFTLIEVLMTVVIVGILASVALRSVQSGIDSSRIRATQDEMDELAWAIAGNPDLYADGMRSDFGYVGDVGALPASLDDLVTNPGGYATWNGPYITGRFTQDADGFKQDAWGDDYTFTGGITIASSGGGATPMTKVVAPAAADLTTNTIRGTITDALGNIPADSSVAITITATYPDGSGGMTVASTNPAPGGLFSIPGVAIGIRAVEAVYRATNDTITTFACVLPRTGAILGFRLPGAPFAVAAGGVGPGTIEFVPGSQELGPASAELEFDITNSGASAVSVSWISVTYSPSAYFGAVRWNGSTVFTETNPRASSGDTCVFTSEQTIYATQTLHVRLWLFWNVPSGWGSLVDMSNTDFAITFSNGSEISFNSGS